MTIEIVDFPINSMVVSHSYVTVYQRVDSWGYFVGIALLHLHIMEIQLSLGWYVRSHV